VHRAAAEAINRRGNFSAELIQLRAARRHLHTRAGAFAAMRDALAARDLPSALRHLLP